jgi:ABC-2 type transport system permease protein
MIMIVGHVTTAWDTYELGFYIRSGRMSAKLLRPVLPMWESLATNMSYKITTLAFVVPMWCLFAWIVKPTFNTNLWQLILGSIAIVLASALNFVIGYVVALIAFWTPKLDAIGEVYFGVGMFFGGRFAPLDALPSQLRSIADILPFRWIFGFPTELTMGRVTDVSVAISGIAWQCVWLAAGILAFRIFWAAAVKRYTAVSG